VPEQKKCHQKDEGEVEEMILKIMEKYSNLTQ